MSFQAMHGTDTEHVRLIKECPETLGLTVFFDTEGLDGGDVFPDMLDREVKSSEAVVGIWSRRVLTRPVAAARCSELNYEHRVYALTRDWVLRECNLARHEFALLPSEIARDNIE